MATRYIIIFAILVTVAAGCCLPKKFEVYLDSYYATARNNLSHQSQTFKYAYDSVNEKLLIDYSNGRKYLYDYSKVSILQTINSDRSNILPSNRKQITCTGIFRLKFNEKQVTTYRQYIFKAKKQNVVD